MPNFKQNLILIKIHSNPLSKENLKLYCAGTYKHHIFQILKALKEWLQVSKNTDCFTQPCCQSFKSCVARSSCCLQSNLQLELQERVWCVSELKLYIKFQKVWDFTRESVIKVKPAFLSYRHYLRACIWPHSLNHLTPKGTFIWDDG